MILNHAEPAKPGRFDLHRLWPVLSFIIFAVCASHIEASRLTDCEVIEARGSRDRLLEENAAEKCQKERVHTYHAGGGQRHERQSLVHLVGAALYCLQEGIHTIADR